jgi:hypothetical protein
MRTWLETIKDWSDRQTNMVLKYWLDPGQMEFEDDIDVMMLQREEW